MDTTSIMRKVLPLSLELVLPMFLKGPFSSLILSLLVLVTSRWTNQKLNTPA